MNKPDQTDKSLSSRRDFLKSTTAAAVGTTVTAHLGFVPVFLSPSFSLAGRPVKIVLIAGKPSHGPGSHEFNAGTWLLAKCLRQTKGVEPMVVKGGWSADESVFERAKSLVFYADGRAGHPMIQANRLDLIEKLMRKGVGLVCIHYAVDFPKEYGDVILKCLGGYYEHPYSTNPINDVEVRPAALSHPIARGWKAYKARDEWYYRIRFLPDDERVTPILGAMLPKEALSRQTIAWATQREDGGRAFGFTGGHFHKNWGILDFRRMVVNAILWTAKVEVPPNGAPCTLSPKDLSENLDDKPLQK